MGASAVKVTKIIEIGEKRVEGIEGREDEEIGKGTALGGSAKGKPLLDVPANGDSFSVDENVEAFGPDTPVPPAVRYFSDVESSVEARPLDRKPALLGDIMAQAMEVLKRSLGVEASGPESEPPPAMRPEELENVLGALAGAGPIGGALVVFGTLVARGSVHDVKMPTDTNELYLGRKPFEGGDSSSSAIIENDPSVSKHHAVITRIAD